MLKLDLLMNGRNFLLKFALFGCILLLQQSCKKGDTGPAGPVGPPGSPNVIYSDWFTPSAYVKDTVFGIWGFKYDKAVPEITQAILDSGTVITYGKLLGYNTTVWPANQVAPLPIQLTYVSGSTMTDTWSALATPGNLRIRFVNDKNYYTSINNTHQFRFIIIPGGKKASVALAAPGNNVISTGISRQDASLREVIEHHDQMSYEEICKRLGIVK